MKNIKKVILSKKVLFESFSRGMLTNIEVDRERYILRLRSTVFSESSFIPFSVRDCVDRIFEMASNKKYPTFLVLDELNNKVDLVQEFEGGIDVPLIKLLKLFTFAARSWAPLLKRIADKDLLEL
jgi:hypothetical protein